MPNYTISLAAALLRRMRAIGRAVNWSFVAREAFERKIDEIDGKKSEVAALQEQIKQMTDDAIEKVAKELTKRIEAAKAKPPS